jgi:chemotaxis protein methyltransferase CheR
MEPIGLSDAEFAEIRAFAMREAGISLSPVKKTLVMGRWSKRLAHYGLSSYREYLQLIDGADAAPERQLSIDLLTTNETYFFREPKHFEFLRELAAKSTSQDRFRVWSAACSSGEEPYSIAMLLEDQVGHGNWDVFASDISIRVLQSARQGLYVMSRTTGIPADYLKRFCLKGTGPYADKLLVENDIKQRVAFAQVNLNETLPQVGKFDVIFLRNVMIYFDAKTKTEVLSRLLPCLKPGGHLCIGHSDTLNGIAHPLAMVKTAIFRKTD